MRIVRPIIGEEARRCQHGHCEAVKQALEALLESAASGDDAAVFRG
jgi:hypothetical protein